MTELNIQILNLNACTKSSRKFQVCLAQNLLYSLFLYVILRRWCVCSLFIFSMCRWNVVPMLLIEWDRCSPEICTNAQRTKQKIPWFFTITIAFALVFLCTIYRHSEENRLLSSLRRVHHSHSVVVYTDFVLFCTLSSFNFQYIFVLVCSCNLRDWISLAWIQQFFSCRKTLHSFIWMITLILLLHAFSKRKTGIYFAVQNFKLSV